VAQVTIQDLRDNYPQYSDLTDQELADKYINFTGNKVLFPEEEDVLPIEDTITQAPEPMIPEAGTYSQDDLAENDRMYTIVKGYMDDRYGKERFEGEDRESIVDRFLNNRRGVSAGNSVRGLSEMDYINDIQDDPDKKARAAAAYQLYENMAGIFSSELTGSEKIEGVMDYARTVLLDPVNLLGGFIGKAAANGSIRVGTSAAKRAALEAMKKEGSQKIAEKVGAKVFADGVDAARKATKARVGHYAQNVLGRTASQRLATKAAITEIGVVSSVDAMVGAGMEYLYQDGLVDVDAQEDINYYAVGIALAGGIILGGVQAGLIARRGVSDTAVVTKELTEANPEGFLSDAAKAIDKYMKQDPVDISRDWRTKVESGKKFAELSQDSRDFGTDFIRDLLLGRTNEEGEVIFKGMTQIAFERGFVWAKRFEEDTFTNWMSDIISGVSNKEAQSFIAAIEKATPNKNIRLRDIDGNLIAKNKVTGQDIGDILSFKMSEFGAGLGAAGQSAKKLGLSVTDQELRDLYNSALDAGFVTKGTKVKDIEIGDRVTALGSKKIGQVTNIDGDLATVTFKSRGGKTTTKNLRLDNLKSKQPLVKVSKAEDPSSIKKSKEFIAEQQNRLIRMLVAHPSTSALNVIGWGANTSLQSTSDLALSLIYAGRGTYQKLLGDMEKGVESHRLAETLFKSNVMRLKLLFDPDMTYTAFVSALQRNSSALQKLDNTLPGGIEQTNKLLVGGQFTPDQKLNGMKADAYIDLIQKLTLVQAQDAFTKSQEFVFQMDKRLRATTGKGWNDFYKAEKIGDMNVKEYMATANYRQIEVDAVDATLEAIFSKSYAGPGPMGGFAKALEEARNIPGLGMAIPFGRFFNNTMAFFGKNTVGLNLILKKSGYFSNMSTEEAITRGAVSVGIIYTLSNQEMENVEKGLPMYATPELGSDVLTQKFDFPVSAYRAAARVLALRRLGRHDEAVKARNIALRDFSLSGLLRNLDRTQRDTLEAVEYIIGDEESRSFAKAAEVAAYTLGTQYVSPLLRPFEPLNVAAGLVRGEDAAPIDRYQNNKAVNNALRYIDNIVPLFTGKKLAEPKETGEAGRADINSTKILGARTIRLSDTQVAMKMSGYGEVETRRLMNASRRLRDLSPTAANAYNGIFHDIIEAESSLLLESKWFKTLTVDERRSHWSRDVVPRAKSLAKSFLLRQYYGDENSYIKQYEIVEKYNKKSIDKAMSELNIKDFERLEDAELFILERYLETEQSLKDRSIRLKKMQ